MPECCCCSGICSNHCGLAAATTLCLMSPRLDSTSSRDARLCAHHHCLLLHPAQSSGQGPPALPGSRRSTPPPPPISITPATCWRSSPAQCTPPLAISLPVPVHLLLCAAHVTGSWRVPGTQPLPWPLPVRVPSLDMGLAR